ncbi:CCC motif membrane protein [Chitinophagaceae bacterium LWZ2-11]
MDNQSQPQNFNSQQPLPNFQQSLPNATLSLVMGILSIFVCCICGIIGLVMANKDIQLYKMNPSAYTESSYNNTKTGRICSIIGLILWGIAIIFYIIFFVVLVGVMGAAATAH